MVKAHKEKGSREPRGTDPQNGYTEVVEFVWLFVALPLSQVFLL